MRSEPSDAGSRSPWTWAAWAAAAAVGVVGVLAVHHPMLLAGFGRLQVDRGDTRLIHYLLEHGYLWATGTPGHSDFWTAPFFYPLRNNIAYSDALLSFGPFYGIWRFAGASPDLAFGLWMVATTAMNYAAGLLVFGGALGFGAPASVAAAGLLAFGAPRVNQLNHQQLLPFYYVLLTLYALVRLMREDALSPGRRLGLWMLAAFGTAAQLYGGVYLGWFLAMGLALATVLALALKSTRGAVLSVARRDGRAVLAASLAGGLAMAPFLIHYLPAAREMRGVYMPFRYFLNPTFGSWWNVGEGNWFWGWLVARRPFVGSLLEHEHRLGIGFLTTAACGAGLYLGRRRPWFQVALWFLFVCFAGLSFLPHRELVLASVGLYCLGFGLMLRQDDDPLLAELTFLVVFIVLVSVRFPNPWLRIAWLALLVMCCWTIARRKEGLVLPSIAIGLISLKLFAVEVVALIAPLIAAAAGLLALVLPSRRRAIVRGAVCATVAALIFLTFAGDPLVLIGGFVGGFAGLAASAPARLRLPPRILLGLLAASLAGVVFLDNVQTLWLDYSLALPGGVAIRAVGRIVLILMIPAAAGLALLIELLSRRRRPALAWSVALVCLAEQTVTTPSFDAAANRATIRSVADRLRPGVATFYYKPAQDEPFVDYSLDAMWASLAVGIPTINGYTGYYPSSWSRFQIADSKEGGGEPLSVLLKRWETAHGLRPEDVQRIGDSRPTGAVSDEGNGLAPTGPEPLR